MSIQTETETVFETGTFSLEPAAPKQAGKSKFQFWFCTSVGSLLLLLGVLVSHSVKGAGSQPMASDLGNLLAAVIWICVPAFIYFAWQGYRQATASR